MITGTKNRSGRLYRPTQTKLRLGYDRERERERGDLEYGDPLERVEVNIHRNLGLEFLRQLIQYRLFMKRLAAGPLVVKPVDDVFFQVMTHL